MDKKTKKLIEEKWNKIEPGGRGAAVDAFLSFPEGGQLPQVLHQGWIKSSPEERERRIVRMFDEGYPHPVWKTVENTQFRTAEDFCQAFKQSRSLRGRITERAMFMLTRMRVVGSAFRLNLIAGAVCGAFALVKGATSVQMIKRADQMGLAPCPDEIAPLLLLERHKLCGRYDQDRKYIMPFMNPIRIKNRFYIFLLVRDDERGWTLDTQLFYGQLMWKPDEMFIFARREEVLLGYLPF